MLLLSKTQAYVISAMANISHFPVHIPMTPTRGSWAIREGYEEETVWVWAFIYYSRQLDLMSSSRHCCSPTVTLHIMLKKKYRHVHVASPLWYDTTWLQILRSIKWEFQEFLASDLRKSKSFFLGNTWAGEFFTKLSAFHFLLWHLVFPETAMWDRQQRIYMFTWDEIMLTHKVTIAFKYTKILYNWEM